MPTEQADDSKLWPAADLKILDLEDVKEIRPYTCQVHCLNEHGTPSANTAVPVSRSSQICGAINGEIVYLSQSTRPAQTDDGDNLTIVLPATDMTVSTVAINGAGLPETFLQPTEKAFENYRRSLKRNITKHTRQRGQSCPRT